MTKPPFLLLFTYEFSLQQLNRRCHGQNMLEIPAAQGHIAQKSNWHAAKAMERAGNGT